MKFKHLFSFTLFILFSASLSAQQQNATYKHCYTDEKFAEAVKENPQLLETRKQFESAVKEWVSKHPNQISSSGNYIIPVVFHVLHNYGPENISDDQIRDQMRVWNEDYQKKNADIADVVPQFQGITADCGMEFRLATIDPNNQCTNGIEHIATPLTYKAGESVKSMTSTWPQSKYLNVWTAATLEQEGAAAYAFYPGLNCPYCGVMSISSYIGSIGTSDYNKARTITHETGHCFDLLHTFGSSNDSDNAPSCHAVKSCFNDDLVADTPPTRGWTCCNLSSANDCNAAVVENIQNFMDYSYCNNMFTEGQKSRMVNTLNSDPNLISLWSPANLIATGTADPYVVPSCAPVCDFHSDIQMVCVGQSVQFSDDTWKSKPVNWTWTFTNGIPASSTDPNPVVQYNTPGSYPVSLTISNTLGTNSKSKTGYITVIDTTPLAIAHQIASEGFEGTQFPPQNGFVQNASQAIQPPNGGPSWQRYAAGHNSSYSMRVVNFNTASYTNGSYAEYVTPAYSFVDVPKPSVTFDVSYAFRTSDTINRKDGLNVYYTLDCGQTWIQRYSKTGSPLVTYGPRSYSTSWVPTSTSWRTETLNISSVITKQPNVRFRFEGVNGRGNNIYIDNININGTVGIDEQGMDAATFDIYPNPTKDYTTVEINLEKTTQVRMELFDITGRIISTIVNDRMWAGTHRFPLNQQLQAGVYLVNMTSGSSTLSKRLIVF